jgi:hypothetical protein
LVIGCLSFVFRPTQSYALQILGRQIPAEQGNILLNARHRLGQRGVDHGLQLGQRLPVSLIAPICFRFPEWLAG